MAPFRIRVTGLESHVVLFERYGENCAKLKTSNLSILCNWVEVNVLGVLYFAAERAI